MRIMEIVTMAFGALAVLVLIGGVMGAAGAPQEAAAAAIAIALVGIPYCITATLQRRALLKRGERE
jgi:ribosomal protein S9